MTDERKLGLIAPPAGFLSSFPSAAENIPALSWAEIEAVAKSGKMDGNKKYDERFVMYQRHNNCASASADTIVAKTIFDRSGEFVKLSDTYTYSWINGGHDQGSMLADACDSIQEHGVCLAESCGPDAIYRRLYDTKKADAEAARFKVRECYAIRTDVADDLMWRTFWTALCLGFKVGVAVQVGGRFDHLDSDGVCGVDGGQGNHAVHSDGIKWAGRLLATSGNTWGTTWGMHGRMNLRQEHFEQTIGVHEHYAVRTAIDDPLHPMPKLS